MDARSAFKVSLLAVCAERGWDISQTNQALEKLAACPQLSKCALDEMAPPVPAAAPDPLAGATAVPPAVGAGASGRRRSSLHRMWPIRHPAAGTVKQAGGWVDAGGKVLSSAIGTLGPFALTALTLGGLGLPLAGGAIAGSTLARARDDDTNIDQAKADETIKTYQQLAEEVRRRARARATGGTGGAS